MSENQNGGGLKSMGIVTSLKNKAFPLGKVAHRRCDGQP